MLSAIILSAALAAGGCGGADYDISFTEDGVQSSTADFVKEGDGYVAELPILEGGTIAPGINEKKRLRCATKRTNRSGSHPANGQSLKAERMTFSKI